MKNIDDSNRKQCPGYDTRGLKYREFEFRVVWKKFGIFPVQYRWPLFETTCRSQGESSYQETRRSAEMQNRDAVLGWSHKRYRMRLCQGKADLFHSSVV
ncbi:hypothetical protein SNE40_011149 [Patella caerulea]|uniref:Uncharacterized protein n=1 Tax=Patella caerulea TaxID=87958 RepID=A0AAN8K3H4_PATCE